MSSPLTLCHRIFFPLPDCACKPSAFSVPHLPEAFARAVTGRLSLATLLWAFFLRPFVKGSATVRLFRAIKFVHELGRVLPHTCFASFYGQVWGNNDPCRARFLRPRMTPFTLFSSCGQRLQRLLSSWPFPIPPRDFLTDDFV